VDIFGVFDGHGGKQAAVYASKHMMSAVLSALDQHIGKDDEDTCENGMCIPTKHAPDAVVEGLNIHLNLAYSISQSTECCRLLCMHTEICMYHSLLSAALSTFSLKAEHPVALIRAPALHQGFYIASYFLLPFGAECEMSMQCLLRSSWRTVMW
jgi:hypothetical protein